MLKHLKNFKLFEDTDSDISLDEKYFRKADFYYLGDDISEAKSRENYDIIEGNEYRAFATFFECFEMYQNIPCTLIALVNYPPENFNKRTIEEKFVEAMKAEGVDEIEFPWSMKYIDYGKEFWRDKILAFSNCGKKIRPMLELGVMNEENFKKSIDFFMEANILSIMTSTGLCSEITTLERWNACKDYIPNKMEVKIGGVLTLSDIKSFIDSGADLIATTLVFAGE